MILFLYLLLATVATQPFIQHLNTWLLTVPGYAYNMTVTIPSTLTMDLIKHHLTSSDIYFRDNILQYYQFETIDGVTYATQFLLPPECHHTNYTKLVMEGLDTHCQVWVNSQRVMVGRNMFMQWELDVTLQTHNIIKVVFNSSANYDLQQAENFQQEHGFALPQNFSFTRKPAYQYGWDWGPRILTVGIWKPVSIRCYDHITLNSLYLQHQPLTNTTTSIQGNITAEVSDLNPQFEYVVEVNMHNFSQILSTKASGKKAANVSMPFKMQGKIKQYIWWTWDLGAPNLIDFTTTIKCSNTSDKVEKMQRTGLRTVKVKEDVDERGKSFTINLNGVDVFMRGGNYIPPQMSMPNVSASYYQSLREQVKFARYNMIRVWGGGQFEYDDFYTMCDEEGILIWHDLMYACALYTHQGQSMQRQYLSQELAQNVRRIRHHPSIALWNGNNEVWIGWKQWGWSSKLNQQQKDFVEGQYHSIFQDILPTVLRELTPSIFYWETSPSVSSASPAQIGEGDIHFWRVWASAAPIEEYQTYTGRFNSEYGMQSMPCYPTILQFTSPSDRTINSYILRLHERHPKGDEYLPMYTEKYVGTTSNLETYVYFSQVMQAYALEMAISSLRGSKPFTMGSLYWQLNDVWPVASWSTVDYYGRYKIAHYHIHHLHNPLLIHSFYSPQSQQYITYLVNDYPHVVHTHSTLKLMNEQNRVLWNRTIEKTMPSLQKVELWKMGEEELQELGWVKETCFLVMETKAIEVEGSSNIYFYVPPKQRKFHTLPRLLVSQDENNFLISVENSIATYVQVKTDNPLPINFQANYFNLLPGQTKKISKQNLILSQIAVTSYEIESSHYIYSQK